MKPNYSMVDTERSSDVLEIEFAVISNSLEWNLISKLGFKFQFLI